jgi:hypothetical protein
MILKNNNKKLIQLKLINKLKLKMKWNKIIYMKMKKRNYKMMIIKNKLKSNNFKKKNIKVIQNQIKVTVNHLKVIMIPIGIY